MDTLRKPESAETASSGRGALLAGGVAALLASACCLGPLLLLMLGVSCGSFAALFGADAVGIVAAGLGGFLGASLRHLLMKRRFKPFIYCLFSALVSASAVMAFGSLTGTPDAAVTASIIFLVPGVPLLNGTADLLTSNYLNGVVRLTRASVILLGSALGFTLALVLWGHI